MKIQVIDIKTNKPLAFTQIRLVIKDKDSGFLRIRTDGNGFFDLEDIYEGEKVGGTVTNVPGRWVTAKDGVVLKIEFERLPVPTTEE